MRNALQGLNRARLRRWLIVFFLALAIPAGVLIAQAYSQLKWEAYHQHQVLAEELAARIDKSLADLIQAEELRSFSDYSFLVVAGDPAANFVQRSPLSAYPPSSAIPGLLGYFQVDTQGLFSSPLLPQEASEVATYGITPGEGQQRSERVGLIRRVLSENRLVQGGAPSPAMSMAGSPAVVDERKRELSSTLRDSAYGAQEREDAVSSQLAFDRLSRQQQSGKIQAKEKRQAENSGEQQMRVEDLKLDYRYRSPAPQVVMEEAVVNEVVSATLERGVRKERSALPELSPASQPAEPGVLKKAVDAPAAIRIRTFESEIDPFEVSLLDSGHFVLFRKVWRDGQRYIQGALIEQQAFLQGVIQPVFRDSALATMSDLIVAYHGNVFASFNGRAGRGYLSRSEELQGALLHQLRLSAPLSDMELIFSIRQLPAGPGAAVVSALAVVMLLVLCIGFYLMYRLGVRQIELALQQQDFVSAVSHELKTPLTSIRMYGEMLREGWASEEKKHSYYDYIYDESERLSRLISNVLQLARMTRNDLPVNLKSVTVAELVDSIRSKVSSQVERAGFSLNVDCEGRAAASSLQLDADYFSQVIINLVDNGLKFSAKAEKKIIDIACAQQGDGSVVFSVRDYGPGIARDQMKKIFKLFYRSENELTRETLGTGIGLALVHQLVTAMGGKVDVVNRLPGAEFRVVFKRS